MPKLMSSLFGKYTVVSVNGVAYADGATVEFSAGDDHSVRFHAKVANIMNGNLKNDNGTLKGMLISTMMWGGEAAMAVEDAFGRGFDEGMTYKKSGSTLTLTSASHKVVLQDA